jgi:hypothetical protein
MKMDLDVDRAEGVVVQGAAADAVVDVAEETKEVAGVDVMMEDRLRAPTNRYTAKRMEAVTVTMMRYS